MNQSVRSAEMTALLAGLLAAQWFSSTAAGFVDACGNAVFFAILLAGALLTLLACASVAVAPQRGLLTVCRVHKGLRLFPLLAVVLFLLLSATALRDALSMVSLSLLPKTPRWCALLFLLPVLLSMGRCSLRCTCWYWRSPCGTNSTCIISFRCWAAAQRPSAKRPCPRCPWPPGCPCSGSIGHN